ncbi:peptidase S8/S53 domain-containing protein [Lactarius deliciosus]|nr:peptidase S8/S53 domain-containing protein [Lactarius deliciosus]
MRLSFALLVALLSHHAVHATRHSFDTHDYYVLEHNPRVGPSLSQVSRRLGVQVVERAGELDNFWVVRVPTQHSSSSLSKRDGEADHVLARLAALRSSRYPRDSDSHAARRIADSVSHLSRQELRQRVKRAPPPIRPGDGDDASKHPLAQAIIDKLDIHDPQFTRQWHLINEEFPEHIMNVTRLWDMGITGHGAVTAFVDDGLDYESEDLADNFWEAGSYDFNDHEDLPYPKLFDDHHGTRCAGQVGAVKNNVCGVGIAYNSKVAGIRILSGSISDVDEASALNYNYQNTSIYSCSWGPPDDGKSMESPSYLIQRAILNGIQNGRDGKGSIFVFASGNGAAYGDQCNFDGYTNSIYSITVAAIDYKGLHPIYSEACAANLVVAYSSGSGHHIVTTDKGKSVCATTHGGTSAAAPNAAGIYTLALSVRPELTWRDLQHLTVRTAEVINKDDPDWDKTASGRLFSYKYGYGRLNGYEFVTAAQNWQLVKPQAWLELPAVQVGNGSSTLTGEMSGGLPIVPEGVTSTVTITQEDLERSNLESLEHLTIRVWITHDRRGDVEVEVISPNGVKSILAARRLVDTNKDGYPGWRFMSVKHWDEDPRGEWTIRVSDIGAKDRTGHFLGWQLSLFGSTIDASIAHEYEIPLFEKVLPSLPSPNEPPVGDHPSATTKAHPKPTEHLPGNHGEAEGEADKPAFENGDPAAEPSSSSSATPSGSMVPTADEGWFSDMSTLVANQRWVFGAAGVVFLFGLTAGIFLCRRAARRRRAEDYSALPGDDLALGALSRGGRGPRTKELYDAFGERGDDDDEADEHTGLRAGSPGAIGVEVGFHEGFLDDEDPNTPRTAPTLAYRDEPEKREAPPRGDAASPSGSGSGSGDGSWEHASQTR